jgi:hypothetical protein
MDIELLDVELGPSSRDRLDETADPGTGGAFAALETFYYAVNRRDTGLLAAGWSLDELARLDEPAGTTPCAGVEVAEHFGAVLSGRLGRCVTLIDAVGYRWPGGVVVAGREVGRYRDADGNAVPLSIRVTRVLGFDRGLGRWVQVHAHSSLDDPGELALYREAVRTQCPGATGPRS